MSSLDTDTLKYYSSETLLVDVLDDLRDDKPDPGQKREAQHIINALLKLSPGIFSDTLSIPVQDFEISLGSLLSGTVITETESNANIPPLSQENNRKGSAKKGGNRDLKGSGGVNSIRVDDAVDAPMNSYSAAQLVQEVLVTGCLTASNITFSGNESVQIGYFNKGNADFPLSEGIVLSTGNVADAEGDNTATNITTEVGTGGDTELQNIATGTVQDASVLEFDFVPAGNTVTFSYIFASEEYPEWSCSEYNDVFGFFVTSLENDGINYNNQNVAQLPGGLGNVSINNVHGPGRGDGSLSYNYDETLSNPFGCSGVSTSTVFSENFSSGLAQWTFNPSQGNWYIKSSKARFDDRTPSRRYNYSYAMESVAINVTPNITTELSYNLQLNDYSDNQQEFMEVEVWDGSSWNSVAIYANDGNFSNSYQIDISAYVTTSQIKVRFRAHGDDSNDIDYWYVDEIQVTQSVVSGSNETDYYSFNTSCSSSNPDYYVDQSSYVYETGTGDCIESVRGFPPYTLYKNIEADGRTVKLTATFTAVPCSTYHIKLAVGDVADRQYDSWVFLEGSSFSSNDVQLTAYGNGVLGAEEIYEGCTSNSLIVSRTSGDNSQELSVDVSYSPAGINGVDIVQMDGSPLPNNITLPPGVDSDTLFYYAVDDGTQEPAETEVFTMSFNTGCPCDPVPNVISLDLTIYDAISLEEPDIISSNVECAGESNGVIVVNPLWGSGVYEFQINGGTWQSSNTFSALPQGMYTIGVRDSLYQFNCQPVIEVDSVLIEEPEPIVASAGLDKTICNGTTTVLNGSGGALFSWSPSDWLNNANVASPVVTPSGVTNTPVSKTYILTVTDANGNCADTDTIIVNVNPRPEVNITANGEVTNSYDVCPDDNTVLFANILSSTQTSSSAFLWNNGETTQSITVSPNSSQTFDVTVENEYGCAKTDIIQLQVYPIYVSVDAITDVICTEDADAGATINVSGHPGIFPVSVNITSDLGYSNSLNFTEAGQQLISNLGIGSYSAVGSSLTIGCTSTDSFIIQASDDTPPVLDFRKPADSVVVLIIPDGQTSGYVSVPEPEATDNCSVSVDNDQTGGANASGTYPLGTTVITYTATDSNGNDVTLTQKVEVYPDSHSSISCPPDINIGQNPSPEDFTIDLDQVALSTANNWTPVDTTYSALSAPLPDPAGTGCDYYRTRTYTATWVHKNGVNYHDDECTRYYYFSQDDEAPTITCAPDVAVNVDSGECYATVTLTAPTTSDNCGVASVTNNAPASGQYPVGTTTVTWTVTDDNGLTATCEQDVVVTDNIAPTITCASDVAVNVDADECYASVTLVAPTTADNCGVASVTNNAPVSGEYPVGTTTVTWTVTDDNGLTATCEQDVVVTDNIAPTITCASDVFVNVDADECYASVTLVAPVTADNCGVASVTNNAPVSGEYPVGTTTVTWTVTDDNGLTATCEQDVVVTDNIAPTITCASDVAVTTDAGVCNAAITVLTPTTTDNCGIASIINDFNGTSDASGTYPIGTTSVKWTVTDNSGNTSSCIQLIEVADDEDPSISNCPSDISISVNAMTCNAIATWTAPTASDNCSISSFASTHNSGDAFSVGTTTVTYTATDAAGNTANCSFNVTVTDVIPTISIDDISVVEGDAGTKAMDFTVSLSVAACTTAISVDYTINALSATEDTDYTATSYTNTLNFAAGETSKTISVNANGDLITENDETFKIVLSGVSNATISDSEAIGTIEDNDAAELNLDATTYSVNEGDGTLTITVTLDTAVEGGVSVNYATSNSSA
ncbi:MAG: hypothetical protein C0593_04915, partial [Marinilabiliales bacterium]